jgi:hypothetical protein
MFGLWLIYWFGFMRRKNASGCQLKMMKGKQAMKSRRAALMRINESKLVQVE